MMPNPVASRRLGVATRPIRLADGNAWGFSLPSKRFKPRFKSELNSEKPIEIEIAVEHSLDVRRRLDDVFDALETGFELERFEAFLGLAAALLQEGHDIDSKTAATLLDVLEDDFPRLILEVVSIALIEAVPPGLNSTSTESERL